MAWWGVALACVLLVLFWPVMLAAALRLQPGRVGLDFSVSALLGRLRLKARFDENEQDEWQLEIRLLHVVPLRRRRTGAAANTGLFRRLKLLARLLARWAEGFAAHVPGHGANAGIWSDLANWGRRPARSQQSAGPWNTGLRVLLRRVRVRSLTVRLGVGTGDAATTAYACGAAWSAWGIALGAAQQMVRLSGRPDVRIQPHYHQRGLRLSADAQASVPPWNALVALLAVGASAVGRRRAAAGQEKSAARV